MIEPAPTLGRDPIARFSDAIGLPRPIGWTVPALRWLTVWYVGNLGWIIGGLATWIHLSAFLPAPGWRYWIVWCGGGAVAIVGLALALARTPIGGRYGWLAFGSLALAMCIFEELLCYAMGTGMWEHESRFYPMFPIGVGVLLGWSFGTALVLRSGGLQVWEALVLCGISGWVAEAFVMPRFFDAPLLLIWIVPLSAFSYLLLVLPGLAVVARSLPDAPADRRRRLRSYLAAVLVPVGCWFAMAVAMGALFKR